MNALKPKPQRRPDPIPPNHAREFHHDTTIHHPCAFGLRTGLASLPPAPMPMLGYSELVFFGDSVSDSGNVALALGTAQRTPQTVTDNGYIPDRPYFPSGRFSNDPVWAENFAAKLGLTAAPSLAGGSNFAWAGARTGGSGHQVPTLTEQSQQFLASVGQVAPSGALYTIAELGNDARDALVALAMSLNPAQTVQQFGMDYAGHLGDVVDSLRSHGAQHFLVFDNVDLGVVPGITFAGGGVPGLAAISRRS